MSKTIGRHKPRSLPKGDYECLCDYCGTVFYRSKLRRDGSGKLFCPDEGEGKDAVTLSQESAQENEPWIRSEHDQGTERRSIDVAPVVEILIGPTGGNSA